MTDRKEDLINMIKNDLAEIQNQIFLFYDGDNKARILENKAKENEDLEMLE